MLAPPSSASNVVAIAAGDNHVLALRADGKVIAWGYNDYGQTSVPADVTNAVRIAAGSTHSMALLEDGSVRFWGKIYSTGVTNPPLTALSNLTLIAPGPTAQHVFTVRSDGTAVEWGNSGYGLPSIPARATNLVDAAVATYHTLALRWDGTPVVWGQYYMSGSPAVPVSATNIIAVAAGFNHDLGLRADGTLLGWGVSSSDGVIPAGATNIVAIACGGYQRLALRADGQMFSWNSGGQTNALSSAFSNIVAIACSTSGNVALSVADGLPLVGRMPRQPAAAGTTVRYRPLVISSTPVSYQWMFDGTNLPWATGATLILTNIQPDQAGNYTLVVNNAFGSVTNSELAITVQPLLFQTQPQDLVVAAGTTNGFSVTAIGQGLGYQWQLYGTNLAGATRTSLSITNIQLQQAGPYSMVVTNSYGTVTSATATLTVVPLFITTQPRSQSTNAGAPVSLSVTTSGRGPYTYQWQLYGTSIPGATTNPLVFVSAQVSDSGIYSVAVSNAYGGVQSSNATLGVVPILISAEPQPQAAFLGQTTRFAVSAGASVPFTYQWKLNGVDINGATTSALVLTNCQYGQNGYYSAVLSTGVDVTNTASVPLIVSQIACWGTGGQSTVPAGISNIWAVAAGFYHTLVLRSDGTLMRWGDNSTIPADLSNVVAIAAGGFHDLAIQADRKVTAWGANNFGQLNVPAELTNAIGISAGGYHSLAISPGGNVFAWGKNDSGQCAVPSGLSNVLSVAGGDYHSLALRADGTVTAWGLNLNRQSTVPAGLSNAVAIAAGYSVSMALISDGHVIVWGSTNYGAIPSGATNIVAIAASGNDCVAVRADGAVFAWGSSYYYGTATVPLDLRNVIGITANATALIADGTAQPQALLRAPALTQSGFTTSILSRCGHVYRLEYKNSLTDSNWTPLPLAAGNGSVLTLGDTSTNAPQRFYRVCAW